MNFDFTRFEVMEVDGLEVKEFDLNGEELWNCRIIDEGLENCFRPADTGNGLRRMKDIVNNDER